MDLTQREKDVAMTAVMSMAAMISSHLRSEHGMKEEEASEESKRMAMAYLGMLEDKKTLMGAMEDLYKEFEEEKKSDEADENDESKLLTRVFSMARDIADQIWASRMKSDNKKYIDEKRQRNLTYDPKGNRKNFTFYMGQFDAEGQGEFVKLATSVPESKDRTILSAMVFDYIGIINDAAVELAMKAVLHDTQAK